jgi:two-component system LytT family response regulator
VTLRVLIVDDEPVARRRIRRLLQQEPDVEIAGECGDGQAAADAVLTLRPDLVFLDVQMPERDGFGVLEAVGPGEMPAVVFVTAYDRYALRAFDVHALDYLLKPFTRERFHEALARARRRGRAAGDLERRFVALLDELRSGRRYLTRFAVRSGGRVQIVEASRVDWIGAADNYVTIHAEGREHLLRETMARLEQQLDPDRFVRIHRSAIVQIDRIKELRPSFHGDFAVLLHDGTRLTLSRGYRGRVERLLKRAL